ncbi:MAG: serine hydrolase [Deltaproteobacteria bacterium]|nr:serine hydrolase [Deltaproteobacteria bacterium]
MLDKKFKKKINYKLSELIRAGAAPGFQLALGLKDESLGVFCAGIRDFRSHRPVLDETWFDLASLTKILSTVDLLMQAVQEKKIADLNLPLKTWFPFFSSELKNQTVLDLLNHCSGLPAVFEETREFNSREEKIKFFLKQIDETYVFQAERPTLYSDVGFMLLGILLEQLYSKRLRDLFDHKENLNFGPQHPSFFSRALGLKNIAAIESLDPSPRLLKGDVQDARAEWLGGDAGHSGLFGTAIGVENWGQELFRSYHGKGLRLSDRTTRAFIAFDSPVRKASFLNGFDTPSSENSQAGKKFGATTIGHLGYTGCSFWMDIETGRRVTLLSHRFAPGLVPETLRKLRPAFHDWLHEEVFSKL